MNIKTICVLGGSGFVGQAVVSLLAARGKQVKVLSRMRERSKELILLPTVEVVEADVHDERELVRQFRSMDAVINLVGVLHEQSQGKKEALAEHRGDFQECHVELPRKVIRACAEAGAGRLLHMSALGASPLSNSAYQRSKGAGEAAVRDAGMRGLRGERATVIRLSSDRGLGLNATIFRPSVIFGRGDGFINLFAQLVRWFPVIPLANANARFQPVWVEDVARAFADSLEDMGSFGQTL